MDLPALSDDEAALAGAMHGHLTEAIAAAGGALSFDRYMELALYAPGLGYYVNGRRKLGEGGDFVTAPEVSPLFSQCLANQVAECLARVGGEILEFGAGTGRMAADMLVRLAELGRLPERYLILELSPDLRALQRETLSAAAPGLLARVEWLESLPAPGFRGVVVANEVLDAMPVHQFRRAEGGWDELMVAVDDDRLVEQWHRADSGALYEALERLWPRDGAPAAGYRSELNLRLAPWLRALAACMTRGYLLLVDYGYTQHEYYHPDRRHGTLICHFRHRVHDDPLWLPGLQDITASVDFSAVAQAAADAGLTLAGYTTQAHFLIDNGLDALLAASDPHDLARHMSLMQGVKRLTLPSEMGERFKVMALACDAPARLSGFRSRDLRDRL